MNRIHDLYRPVSERRNDYAEVERALNELEVADQARRCQNCGIPFCHGAGCPLGNRIPDFNAALRRGEWREAWEILSSTSPFPEFTSRICPALCEEACTAGIAEEPVMVRQLEKRIVETAFANDWVRYPEVAANFGTVAVVGAGPAGLAAADRLIRAGFRVTLYDRHAAPGGLLRYGIPDFKLDKKIVARRWALMAEAGARFVGNTEIGRDVSADYLTRRFDAVLIACGTPLARDLPIPGREFAGIHPALEFLSGQERANAGELDRAPIDAHGKTVVVIGGGDTGSDCVGTARRQGAARIIQLELMPEPPAERSASTPWPAWPYKQRTSSSHLEGCERLWNIQSQRFRGDGAGHVTAVETSRVQWEFSPLGKPLKFNGVPGSDAVLPADLVLLAMGFLGVPKTGLAEQLQLEIGPRGVLLPNPENRIFACGDAARGQSLVVRAIVDGRAVADEIIQTLKHTGGRR